VYGRRNTANPSECDIFAKEAHKSNHVGKEGGGNDEMYQLDATIVIYYHKYLYMFRASIGPSSGVQVCYCVWCSALGVVVVVLRSRCVVLCTVS
jgi:hypothetical protein